MTNGSDEYTDTETAHECVVILGDKDFDLINRVARIEAKMNVIEEEKVYICLNHKSMLICIIMNDNLLKT